jgi:hypothetical protein
MIGRNPTLRRLPVIAAMAVTAFWAVGCGGSISAGSPTPTTQATGAATSPPTVAPTPTPSSLEGPVGTPFTDTDAQSNVMSVTLTQVIDPAKGSSSYTTPDNGKRFVGAKFKIVGVSGTFSSDANSFASVIGDDSQSYSPDFSDIAGCTNFNSGEFSVTPGASSVGCVVFQVPNSVKVAHVQWGAAFGGAPAIWDV